MLKQEQHSNGLPAHANEGAGHGELATPLTQMPTAALTAFMLLNVASCTGAPLYVPPDKPGDPAELEPEPDLTQQGLFAYHNIASQKLPMPSDLWMAGGLVQRPPVVDRSASETALLDKLVGRDGWPRQSSVYFPLSGRLSAATSSGDARLFDLDTQEAVPFTLEFENRGLRLVPIAPLREGGHYVYALLKSATDDEGESLDSATSFRAILGDEELDDREDEALRTMIAPWLAALEQRGVMRSEVAVAGAFRTSTRPTPRFRLRPANHALPSAFLRRDDGTFNLAAGTVDALLTTRLDEYDGFSSTAAIRFQADAALDPEGPLREGALRLFQLGSAADVDANQEVPETQEFPEVYPTFFDPQTYVLAPEVAFPSGQDLALVVRGPITASGRPLESDLADLALLLDDPLLVDDPLQGGDVSSIRILSLSDAVAIEPQRSAFSDLRDVLRTEAGGLENILQIRAFSTLSVDSIAKERRQRLYDDEVPTTPTEVLVATPFSRGLWLLMPNVETIISGKLPTQRWLNATTRADRDDGPTAGSVAFVLTLPEGTPADEPVPVVLFGHGLLTTRELVYVLADFLAQQGFASFAIDFPYHGEDSICLSDLTCPGESRCSLYGQCLNEAGEVVEIGAIEPIFWGGGPRIPPTTGQAFIDLDNLMATRDHFLQALVDLSQAVRAVKNVDWSNIGPLALDGDDVVYLGISLGGILGASLAGIEDNIQTYALNVPGAGLIELMQNSTALGPQLDNFLDDNGYAIGSPAYYRFESDAKWAFDPIDPVNLAPRPGSETRILIQMAEGDAVVPNSATRKLSAATGVEISIYNPLLLGHGFLGDPTLLESGRARDEIATFFEGR